MDVHPLVCHPLQKNNCGMSCSFHLAITGELTAVQQGWCTRIAASIRTVSAKCSLYNRSKQQISSNSWAAIWLVLSFQSRKTNMNQSGSLFRIERTLHHHQSGDSHHQAHWCRSKFTQNFQKMSTPPGSPWFPQGNNIFMAKIPLFHNENAALPRNRSCSKAWHLRINQWTESRRTWFAGCRVGKESSWVEPWCEMGHIH